MGKHPLYTFVCAYMCVFIGIRIRPLSSIPFCGAMAILWTHICPGEQGKENSLGLQAQWIQPLLNTHCRFIDQDTF